MVALYYYMYTNIIKNIDLIFCFFEMHMIKKYGIDVETLLLIIIRLNYPRLVGNYTTTRTLPLEHSPDYKYKYKYLLGTDSVMTRYSTSQPTLNFMQDISRSALL